MHSFVPKNRRPRFELILQLHDLNNIPLVTGGVHIRWNVEGNSRNDARGRTEKEPIREHKVTWMHTTTCEIRMTIDRTGMLSETNLVLEVVQETSNGGKDERVLLGTVKLNLAEYVAVDKETRRYLLQDSKINSTLKVSIALSQLSGDTQFMVPQLKTAHIFGAITGVVSDHAPVISNGSVSSDRASDRNVKSTSPSRARDARALQDMFKTAMATTWKLQGSEMDADDCIDDIFAGGDGWKDTPSTTKPKRKQKNIRATHSRSSSRHLRPETARTYTSGYSSDTEDESDASSSATSTTNSIQSSRSSSRHVLHSETSSIHTTHSRLREKSRLDDSSPGSSIFRQKMHTPFERRDNNSPFSGFRLGNPPTIERRPTSRSVEVPLRANWPTTPNGEVDEFDLREDLRSWVQPVRN